MQKQRLYIETASQPCCNEFSKKSKTNKLISCKTSISKLAIKVNTLLLLYNLLSIL